MADSAILIEGAWIVAVGARADVDVPDGAQIVDATGKTVIPGLIDLHSHYGGDVAKQLAAQLAFGVVGVRSIGTDTPATLETFGQVSTGTLPGPVIVTAGSGFTHPEGHPVGRDHLRRPTTPEEAREGVRELAAQNVGFTKMWVDSKYGSIPKITRDIREAVVDESLKNNLVPVAHIFDEEDFYHLDSLGMTDFLHAVRDKEPMDGKFLNTARKHGSTFASTLTVIESNWLFLERPSKLTTDPEAMAASSAATLQILADDAAREERLRNPLLPILKPEFGRAKRFFRQIHEAGITITLGSDSNGGMIPMGWGSHNEMRPTGRSRPVSDGGFDRRDVSKRQATRTTRRSSWLNRSRQERGLDRARRRSVGGNYEYS